MGEINLSSCVCPRVTVIVDRPRGVIQSRVRLGTLGQSCVECGAVAVAEMGWRIEGRWSELH